MELRDYQKRVVEMVLAELNDYERPFVVNAFQSSGKSIMIAELVRRLNTPVLILCMSKELVDQDVEKLKAVGADATIYSASCGEKVISDITVATIGSIYKHPSLCRHFKVVIVDECDAVPVDKKDSMYMKLLRNLDAKVVGWTGTPFRMVNQFRRENNCVIQQSVLKSLEMLPFWYRVLNGVEWQELHGGGFVANHKYYVDNVDKSMLRMNSTGLDFTEQSLESFAEKNRYRTIANVLGAIREWNSKRVLVTVPSIEEAELVAEKLKELEIPAEHLSSKMKKKERAEIIGRFKSGETRVVVQVLILNVGFDLPVLDCIVFARPSMSLRIWCQTVARGIRKDPDNPNKLCRVIDMGGELERFGRIEHVKHKEKTWVIYGTDKVVKAEGKITGDHGQISDKILNEVNITQMRERMRLRKRREA